MDEEYKRGDREIHIFATNIRIKWIQRVRFDNDKISKAWEDMLFRGDSK